MQSQRFADDEQEQERLRNIQRQQHAHQQQHLSNLKNKQDMASVHQQQYTAPQSWRQQTGQASAQQHCSGGFGIGASPQQYSGGASPQPRGNFCGAQSYPAGNQGCGQQFSQSGGQPCQQGYSQQQHNQGGGQLYQHPSDGQQEFRRENLYNPSQLQQQRYYAEDDEEQRRLAQIKQQQQQHEQRYLQSLSQHQNQPRTTTFGTDFRGAANPQYQQHSPRAGQLQSQQFADDQQEQERLRQIAEQQKLHQQRYHQSLKQHQQEAQNRNKFMFGGMDFTRK